MNHEEALQIYQDIRNGKYKMLRKAIKEHKDDEVDYYYVAQLVVERNNILFLHWLAKHIGPLIILAQVDELLQIAEKHCGNKQITSWLKRLHQVDDAERLENIYKIWLNDPYFILPK